MSSKRVVEYAKFVCRRHYLDDKNYFRRWVEEDVQALIFEMAGLRASFRLTETFRRRSTSRLHSWEPGSEIIHLLANSVPQAWNSASSSTSSR